MSARFGRVITAMVTPFDEQGELDLDAAAELAQFLVETGSDGLALAGTTGESPALSDSEALALFRRVRDAVSVPLLAGAGSNSTRHAVEFTRAVTETGVDGILSVCPYYNRPSQRGIEEHFGAVAQATDLPVVIYDIPMRTGRKVETSTLLRLARSSSNIVALKDAAGDPVASARVMAEAPDGFELYSGEDSLTLSLLAAGACGVISVASHWAATRFAEMIDAFLKGDVDTARRAHGVLADSCAYESTAEAPNPIPTKAMLRVLGLRVWEMSSADDGRTRGSRGTGPRCVGRSWLMAENQRSRRGGSSKRNNAGAAKSPSAKSQSGKSQSGKSQSGKSQSGKSQPGRSQSGKSQSGGGRSESPKRSANSARQGASPVTVTFLGGLGEIGRNCAAVEQDDQILLIDCGLMFPDNDMLGIDLVLPDFSWLLERADRIVGLRRHPRTRGPRGWPVLPAAGRLVPAVRHRVDPRAGPRTHRRGRAAQAHRVQRRLRRRTRERRTLRARVPTGHPFGARGRGHGDPHRTGRGRALRRPQDRPHAGGRPTDGPDPHGCDR